MPRENSLKNQHMRARIAAAAARMIAEDGLDDYALAKRKAARQLGADSTHALPGNDEIEDALRDYQALYQADEQPEVVRELRECAADIMQELASFHPYLHGAVLSGTAGRYSPVELQLFTDDSKMLEIFLLDRRIPFEASDRRPRGDGDRTIAVIKLEWDDVPVVLSVHVANDERVAVKLASGARAERANLAAVRQLLGQA
jgi:hypothetical protein